MHISMTGRMVFGAVVALFGGFAAAGSALAGPTLDKVKAAGMFSCGVPTGIPGYAQPDAQGLYSGFDIDVCKALSAALFGDPGKVKYVPLTAQQRFTALQSGEVDVLSNNTTWTLSRDTDLGLDFGPVVFYDGQGFLVPKKLNLKSAKELNGATICVQPGTTTELNLADYFRSNKMDYKPVVIEKIDEVYAAFFSGRCDVMTGDASALAAQRIGRASNPDDYVILPERISKEPLAPVVRHGDDQWHDVVDWVVYALIQAEESGITKANVDDTLKSDDPSIKRMLGVTPGLSRRSGSTRNGLTTRSSWSVITVERFDRNIGAGSPMKLERGLNNLWTKGGLLYAMPLR